MLALLIITQVSTSTGTEVLTCSFSCVNLRSTFSKVIRVIYKVELHGSGYTVPGTGTAYRVRPPTRILKMVNYLLISGIGFKRAGWESACGEVAFAWR